MADMVEMVFVDTDGKGQPTGKPYGGKDVGLDGTQYLVVNSHVKVPAHLASRLADHGFVSVAQHNAYVVKTAAEEAMARNKADLAARYRDQGAAGLHGDQSDPGFNEDVTHVHHDNPNKLSDSNPNKLSASNASRTDNYVAAREANKVVEDVKHGDATQDVKDAARAANLNAAFDARRAAPADANYRTSDPGFNEEGTHVHHDKPNETASPNPSAREENYLAAREANEVVEEVKHEQRDLQSGRETARVAQAAEGARRNAEQSMGPARDADARAEANRRAQAAQVDANKKAAAAKKRADEAKG